MHLLNIYMYNVVLCLTFFPSLSRQLVLIHTELQSVSAVA